MSFARAIRQTVEGIPGVISSDHMADDELQDLADAIQQTEQAVRNELLERAIQRGSRLLASFPWPSGDMPDCVEDV